MMRMGICVPFTKLQRSQVFVEAPSFSVLLIRAEHKVIIICVNKASASIKHQLISGQLLQGQHLSPAGVMIGEDYLLELHSKTSLAHTVRTASLTSSQFSSTWGETMRYVVRSRETDSLGGDNGDKSIGFTIGSLISPEQLQHITCLAQCL